MVPTPSGAYGIYSYGKYGNRALLYECLFRFAGISRTRYTLAGGLLAAFVSLAASVIRQINWLCN